MKPNIAYSCVVDHNPDSYFQSLIFISSLRDIANVPSENIFIHIVGVPDDGLVKIYEQVGVNVVYSSFYDSKCHCLNPLIQLNTPRLADYEKIVLCDCAVAISEAIEPLNFPKQIYAKEVDLPNPPIWVLHRLLGSAGIEATPEEIVTTLRSDCGKYIMNTGIISGNDEFSTLSNNCNGGILVIDGTFWPKLCTEWPRWADWLLSHRYFLGCWSEYSHQISMALATWSVGISVERLPVTWNFPLHLPLNLDSVCVEPKVINYHGQFNTQGLIRSIGVPSVDKVINVVNKSQEQFLAVLAATDPGRILNKRRQRWVEWNNIIKNRPVPLPDHMATEKPLIAIETSGECNYRCSYCPVSIAPLRKGNLNEQIFQSIIDELMPDDGSFQLRFHFYNEPLLDDRLPRLINYARRRLPSTYIRLVTNGQLLDVEYIEILFSSGVDQIAASCHKEEVFVKLAEICNNNPEWNLELRKTFSSSVWSDRRGTVDLQSHGFKRTIPAGVQKWGCSFVTLQIDYQGKVHMCCEDFNSELVLGNVVDESLKAIINRNLPLLQRTFCGFFDAPCLHCAGLDQLLK